MTAQTLSAQQAYEIGLVTSLFDDDSLEDQTREAARRMAHYPPTGMKNI